MSFTLKEGSLEGGWMTLPNSHQAIQILLVALCGYMKNNLMLAWLINYHTIKEKGASCL